MEDMQDNNNFDEELQFSGKLSNISTSIKNKMDDLSKAAEFQSSIEATCPKQISIFDHESKTKYINKSVRQQFPHNTEDVSLSFLKIINHEETIAGPAEQKYEEAEYFLGTNSVPEP